MKKPTILSPFAKPKPWRRGRAHPVRRDLAICDRPPLAQIDIYQECVLLTRRKSDGTWSSYPIDPDALAAVLAKLPVSTGFLPTGTLAVGQHLGKQFVVQLIRPRAANLQVEENGNIQIVRINIPPLIWAGWEREYRIWALREPSDLSRRTRLYVAPFPNVYSSGGICWGNAQRPRIAAPEQMAPALKLFLEETVFSTHIAGGKSRAHEASILRRYDTLSPEQPYPLDDLVEDPMSLGHVIDGSVWGGGR